MTAIIEKIENAIREEYPELGNFTLEEVEGRRMNQTGKGLVLKLEGSNICPTVYLPEKNERDVKEIAKALVEATKKTSEISKFTEVIKDFGKCKDKIFPVALNRERNEIYLSDKTHFSHDNVAEVFVVLSDDGEGSVTVSSSIMEMWKIDEKVLRCVAEENLKREVCIAPLQQVVKEMGVELPDDSAPEIVVATTKARVRGAGLLFYPHLLREKLGTEDEYYVIPSSVHELLLFPKQETEEKEVEEETLRFKRMIWETNRTAVEPEEFLSDDLYFFKEGKIESLGCYQP